VTLVDLHLPTAGPAEHADLPPASQVPLRGRRVALVAPGPALLEAMYALSVSEEVGFRWRFHGRVVGPDEFAATLWNDVLTQHVAVRATDGAPVAWLAAYAPNLRDGHARLAVAAWPAFHGRVATWESVFLFVRYLFANWAFRKLYAEVRAFNLGQFASGAGRLFDVEGVLRAHAFHDGRYWDQYVLAVTREQFASEASRVAPLFDEAPVGEAAP
jgi:RimJ/RimL family protein N-acetyltransferase